MVLGIDETLLTYGSWFVLAVALVVSLVVLFRFSDLELSVLRERLVFGVPWGTILVVVVVALVYYLLQGGGKDGGPIVTGFRSWSLWYPQGLVLSSFAHASESHLVGNLLGTVAFAPIAEFAWGHYGDGEHLDRPATRIGAFVATVVAVGLAGALFVPGAVIGFSGVVFAFAGFALVSRPIAGALAILGLRVVSLVWRAARSPWFTAKAEPSFVSPWWADVALQGHLFGVVVGILLAVGLWRVRDDRPELIYVWFAFLVFAVTRSMYAVYWYLGADEFVLFQAVGAAGVFLLASLVAVATLPTDRVIPRLSRDVPVSTAAASLLLATLCLLALAGMGYNLASVDSNATPENTIEVGDYTVTYAENAEDQYIAGLQLPSLDGLSVRVSGVIVISENRNVWELSRSANQLAFDGEATIPVGGPTWRETVYINRTEWAFLEGNSTYKVYGTHDGDRQRLYADDPAVGEFQLNHSNVSIHPSEEFYDVVVERNGSRVGEARIPADNESITLGSITFERDEQDLIARHEGTRIRIAEYRLSKE